MPNTIISDTSCLIILSKVDEIKILRKLYQHIITTPEISQEYGKELPSWISIVSASDKQKQLLLETQIDKGEASAIALALEIKNSTLIIDDYKARKIAERLGITYTGTIGVIIKAKLRGIIPSVKPILNKIYQTDFRLSEDIIINALREAGEQ